MRIAWVTETFSLESHDAAFTGWRAVSLLRARGHRVCVFRPRGAGEPAVSNADAGRDECLLPGLAIPMYPELRFGLRRPSVLRKLFEKAEVQLVHVATEFPLGWAAARAACQLGIPVTSDIGTSFQGCARGQGLAWLEPLVQAGLRRFHNGKTRSFVTDREVWERLTRLGFERLRVVARGVDTARFSPRFRSTALRVRWRAEDAPVLLYVGRLAADQNVELAFHAFRVASRFVPNVRMVVVGTGPLRAALARQFPEVNFVGAKLGDNLARHYASADLFLFPSLSDNFGNVVLESLASGLPVLAFARAAAAEHVQELVNGRLVSRGNEHDFVIAACMLTRQPQALTAMRPHARAAAIKANCSEALLGLEKQLEQVLSHHPARGRGTAQPG